jgi:hypothetical protein
MMLSQRRIRGSFTSFSTMSETLFCTGDADGNRCGTSKWLPKPLPFEKYAKMDGARRHSLPWYEWGTVSSPGIFFLTSKTE